MTTVLLLTDFSKTATNAVHYAMHFFKDYDCKFYVMHVHKAGSFISDDLMASPTGNIYESITKAPKRNLNRLISELKETYQNPKHNFESIVDFDVFSDAIYQVFTTKAIDIIVMGSNGKTGAIETIFGSNTINVIRTISCKTMVIPENYTFKPISNFLFPLQCNDIINTEQLHTIESFNKHHNFKLHLLRVCDADKSKTKYDLNHLDPFDWTYHIEDSTDFFEVVSTYLATHDIDMTSLIIHDKSFVKRLLTETPALELSKVIKLPLFIFHI